jgi:hypothetical protein
MRPRFDSLHARTALAALVTVTLALIAAGCGGRMELPTERRDIRKLAGQGTYQMITTRQGLGGIWDILLTPSGELFLLFKTGPTSGIVREFPPGLNAPLSTQFPGLLNPGAIAFGANHLFILDQGDTASARITRPSGYETSCGPLRGFSRPIADLAQYWYVREFQITGAPVSSFTDTTFLWVNGIAADAAGRVYVSGVLATCVVDPFNQFVRTFDSRFGIRRYERGANDGTVIGDGWRRDATYELIEGTGIGSTNDPRGMQWAFVNGAALYFADTGNNEVQKFADPTSGGASFKLDFGGSGADSIPLAQPVDVSVDSAGYVYVADFGNQRVLRYSPEGDFVQRVDIEPDAAGERVMSPIAVAADNEQVFVADPGRSEVVRYRRRK